MDVSLALRTCSADQKSRQCHEKDEAKCKSFFKNAMFIVRRKIKPAQ